MLISNFTKNISKYRKELMGLSAIFIFIFHNHAEVTKGIFFIGQIEEFVKRILFYGVDIFMLLSGFGVVYSLKKNDLKKFYLNRIIRIYPPIIIIGLVYKFIYGWKWVNFFKRVSGISFFQNMYSFLWFFTAILILYLISPIINYIINKINNKLLFSFLFLIGYIILINILNYIFDISFGDYYGFFNRIPIYVFGMVCGSISTNNKLNQPFFNRRELLISFVCLLLGLFLAYLTNYRNIELLVPISNCFLPNILLSISTCYIVTTIFELKNNKLQSIIKAVLCFFGSISFEFYVVQELISDKLHLFLSTYGHLDAIKFNITCLFLATIFAYFLSIITNFIATKLKEIYQ